MKPGPFAISVIWGNGHHYFIGHCMTREEGITRARAEHTKLSKKKNRRGNNLKPRVIVWNIIESIQGEDVEPLSW